MRHKHADIIIAWVNGATIEYQSPTTDEWFEVPNVNDLDQDRNYLEPNPLHPEYDYNTTWRIKQ